MKKIFRKLIAVFCTGLIMSCAAVPCAGAEKADSLPELPSGADFSEFISAMNDYDTLNSSNEEPSFASAALGVFQGDESYIPVISDVQILKTVYIPMKIPFMNGAVFPKH